MIQSRAQFGVRGAVVPLLLVIVMYVGFFASGSVLAGQAVGELTHTNDTTGIVVFAAVTAVTATLGYRVIHALGRIASTVCALAFVYLAVRLLDRADVSALLHDAHFSLPVFLLAVSLSASWQLAFRAVRGGLLALPAADDVREGHLLVDPVRPRRSAPSGR